MPLSTSAVVVYVCVCLTQQVRDKETEILPLLLNEGATTIDACVMGKST